MISISAADLAIVRAILDRHLLNGEVWAFGSRVTGKYKSYSDLDLAIVGNSKLDIYSLANIQDDFQESSLNYRVDVLDYHNVSEEFQRVICSCHEVIWKK